MKRCLAILLSALLLMMSVPMVSADGIYNDDQFNWSEGVCPHDNVVEIDAVAVR